MPGKRPSTRASRAVPLSTLPPAGQRIVRALLAAAEAAQKARDAAERAA